MTVFENVFVAATHRRRPQRERGVPPLRSTRSSSAACSPSPTAGPRRSACSTASGSSSRARWRPIPVVLLLDEIGGGPDRRRGGRARRPRSASCRRRGIAIVWIEHIVHVLVQVVDAARLHGRRPRDRRRRARGRDGRRRGDRRLPRERAGVTLLAVEKLDARHGLLQAVRDVSLRGRARARRSRSSARTAPARRRCCARSPARTARPAGAILFDGARHHVVACAPARPRWASRSCPRDGGCSPN